MQINSKDCVNKNAEKTNLKGKIRKFQPYYHQKHKNDHILPCPQQNECCSKHQNCIHKINAQNSKVRLGLEHFEQTIKQDIDFSISSDLLKEQQPEYIDVHPFDEPNNQHPQVQWIVNENLKRKKQEFLQKKINEQKEKEKRKEALKQLAKNSKKALSKSKKKSFDKPANSWNHGIFETALINTRQVGQNQKQAQTNKNKMQRDQLIKLKPIKQRIIQYKKTKQIQKEKQEHQLHGMNCCHKDHSEEQISKINAKINQNSKAILEKNKSQKQAVLNDKRLKQAKIKALHIKSLESLKHFKKKPVPQDGEFVFDIPLTQKGKKNKKPVNSKRSQGQQKANTQNKQSLKSLQNTKKIRKTGNYPPQEIPIQQTKDLHEQEKQKLHNKFYFWDVPIVSQDFSVIVAEQDLQNSLKQINQTKNHLLAKSKPMTKTFKQQVEDYLIQKFKKRMITQVKQSKQTVFLANVQKKKKQLMEQYKNTIEEKNIMDQIIWNQDEEFRLHQLQNFDFFPKKSIANF